MLSNFNCGKILGVTKENRLSKNCGLKKCGGKKFEMSKNNLDHKCRVFSPAQFQIGATPHKA